MKILERSFPKATNTEILAVMKQVSGPIKVFLHTDYSITD